MNKIYALGLIFTLSILCSIHTIAQSTGVSQIEGTIIDATTGEKLYGANIAIKGTSLGDATDLNGAFKIIGIPAGQQTLQIRYIGFADLDTALTLSANQSLSIKLEISQMVIMGEEVVVTVQARGQMAAINQQRASDAITNIVSSDKIKEVPDVTAAESIGRLPGVAISRSAGEGNKVIVRGLDPKYTNIKIDGVRISGTGGDRSVGLNSIAPEMLDGIELTKSLTADKEADALAGEINLRTRVAQSGFHMNGEILGNYNGLAKSVNGYRFSLNAGNRFFEDKLGVLVNVGSNQFIREQQSISNNYTRENQIPDPSLQDKPISAYYYDNSNININETTRKRVNGNVTLDYKTEFMQLKFRSNINRIEDSYINRNNTFVPLQSDKFRYNINEGNPITINQLYALQTEFKIKNSTLYVDGSYTKAATENQTDRYNFIDKTAIKSGLSPSKNDLYGQYATDAIDKYYDISKIDKAYLDDNRRDTINNQDETYTGKFDWKMPYSLSDKLSGYLKVGAMHTTRKRKADKDRIESHYRGGIGGARADLIYGQNPDFQIPKDIPGYTANVGIPALNYEDVGYDYGEVLKGEHSLGWSADMNKLKQVHNYDDYDAADEMFYQDGIESNKDDYETTETYNAAYIMAQIKIGQKLMLLPGIRYEKMQTQYLSNWVKEDDFAPSGMEIGWPEAVELTDRKNENWFPSVNVKYDAFKWMDVRAAYNKSTTRPNFSSLSPGVVLNNDGDRLNMNNPYLRPGIAYNYDLGVSFFTNKAGLFSANIFYKDMKYLQGSIGNYKPKDFTNLEGAPQELLDQMEQHIYDPNLVPQEFLTDFNGNPSSAQVISYPFNNPDAAYVKGLELSWQTSFWYLPGLLRGIVLDLNVTFIESEATYPYLEYVKRPISKPPFSETIPVYKENVRQMNNQPGAIYNARLGWDYKGFSSRISFRYEAKNITSESLVNYNRQYRDELFRIDLNVQQKITKNLTATLNIANLGNAYENVRILEVIPDSRREEYNIADFSGDELSKEFYGLQAQIGLRFSF